MIDHTHLSDRLRGRLATAFFAALLLGLICTTGLADDEPEADVPDRTEQADALLAEGSRLYSSGEYDEARQLWERIERDYADTPVWPKAVLRIADDLQTRGQYEGAIERYQSVLKADLVAPELDDSETAAMVTANHRGEAQWGIGECYRYMGDFEQAMAAYRLTMSTHRRRSWCGNCNFGLQIVPVFHEAVCLDNMGQWEQAARGYFRVLTQGGSSIEYHARSRLATLYEATGQLDDLTAMLDRWDAAWWAMISENVEEERAEQLFEQKRPSRQFRRLLEFRTWQQAGQLDKLLAIIVADEPASGPRSWEPDEAVKLLAMTPDETTALLASYIDEMPDEGSRRGINRIHRILGMCGTPPAVELLAAAAHAETNSHLIDAIVQSLLLAGEPGQAVIDELIASPPHSSFRRPLAQAQAGIMKADILGLTYPQAPSDVVLPTDIVFYEDRASK